MRRARGYDDARLAELDPPDAVVGCRLAEPVALDRVGHDHLDLLGRHLGVGLVLEEVDLARDAGERDDRASARVAHALEQRLDRQRLRVDRAAAHRRDQRELVVGPQHHILGGDLAVDRHHDGDALGDRERRDRVAHGGAVGKLHLDEVAPGSLAQDGEQTHRYLHGHSVRSAA
jgi:hypothetical protein